MRCGGVLCVVCGNILLLSVPPQQVKHHLSNTLGIRCSPGIKPAGFTPMTMSTLHHSYLDDDTDDNSKLKMRLNSDLVNVEI